jgi:hypothetical protein
MITYNSANQKTVLLTPKAQNFAKSPLFKKIYYSILKSKTILVVVI